MSATVHVIPTFRYRNAPAAIEWLCTVLGFERRMVVEDDDGGVRHAQLTFGNGMIMLGSEQGNDFDRVQCPLPDPDAAVHSSPYLVVASLAELERIHAKVQEAGGRIVVPLMTEDHGSMFSCRDPEGMVWNFGDYDPWA